ncbi:hypothetical protein QYE76_026566 [Lolium multiflorum]|uniref:Uncharacterized protein n=1 Tax=Lolium multiflorum TaxID=4521 RepID=A0AAD8VVQ4_LOLMU|nr:hypothetical protein QYE76_026566 [Lolium multiflorum]
MENYSSSWEQVMKMAVEMAAVSMEKPSGALPHSGVPNRDSSPRSWLRDGGGSGRREMNHIATGTAPSLDGELLPPHGSSSGDEDGGGDGSGVDGEAFRGTSPFRRYAGTETPVPHLGFAMAAARKATTQPSGPGVNYSLLIMEAAMAVKMAVETAVETIPGQFPVRQGAERDFVPPNWSFAMAAALDGFLCKLPEVFRTNVDPNNVPLASLVAQEEHVDVNYIKNNNFNNNAYRNNSSNNYRPYPYNNGNGYGNSYGNYYNNDRNTPPGLEDMLKEFISTQTAFNKSVEEKLGKIDILASKVDSLAADVDLLKSKVMPNENHNNKIVTTANAIQVRINENIRLMAELRARWEREENEKEDNIAKVWTITTTSNANAPHVAAHPTINNKRIGVSNVSTSNAKREKLPETAKTAEIACDKTAEFFSNIGDDDPIALDYNGLNFDDCHISEVIKFLQKLAKSPNASAINLAFTKHITNALIKAREEKLEREASIPRKLEDGWEPIIKMKVNDFDCNALCDLGASISVMPKKIYNMLDLPPLKNCYLDVNLADHSTKKPLGRVDNVRITINNNLVPVDFVVLDIECNASCPIILGRPFLRTVGAIIDMKEGDKVSTCQCLWIVG